MVNGNRNNSREEHEDLFVLPSANRSCLFINECNWPIFNDPFNDSARGHRTVASYRTIDAAFLGNVEWIFAGHPIFSYFFAFIVHHHVDLKYKKKEKTVSDRSFVTVIQHRNYYMRVSPEFQLLIQASLEARFVTSKNYTCCQPSQKQFNKQFNKLWRDPKARRLWNTGLQSQLQKRAKMHKIQFVLWAKTILELILK